MWRLWRFKNKLERKKAFSLFFFFGCVFCIPLPFCSFSHTSVQTFSFAFPLVFLLVFSLLFSLCFLFFVFSYSFFSCSYDDQLSYYSFTVLLFLPYISSDFFFCFSSGFSLSNFPSVFSLFSLFRFLIFLLLLFIWRPAFFLLYFWTISRNLVHLCMPSSLLFSLPVWSHGLSFFSILKQEWKTHSSEYLILFGKINIPRAEM
jgi:hypothetical protein